ncbi:hypothetical protein D1007_14845 [Hordeum vulgare]|nr:hypothetical protein D1007_14845 [Hordeum vulgare]
MLDDYAPEKLLNIIVIKATEPNPGDLSIGNSSEAQIPIDQVGKSNIISINEAGVLFPFEIASSEELYDVPICTAQPEEHNIPVEEENEIIDQLKQMRKQREDHVLNFEGDTEVEEMCPEVEDSDTEPETTLTQTFKAVGKARPITRSHKQAETEVIPDFIASDDSGCFPGDYGISDSDDEGGIEAIPLPCGRKSQDKMDKREPLETIILGYLEIFITTGTVKIGS